MERERKGGHERTRERERVSELVRERECERESNRVCVGDGEVGEGESV